MLYFFFAFSLSIFLTLLTRKLALKFKIVDLPDGQRKVHKGPVALLGGIAIFLSFWLVVGYLAVFNPILGIDILASKLFWVFIASIILIILGVFDDIKQLSPKLRLLVTAVACIIAILGGLSLEKITNPFGGIIQLNSLFILADLIVFIWLMGMMYTTKVLDGLDGLTTGIALIAAVMIFFLTNTQKYFQPNVGLIALIFAGCLLGFLIFNFHPAKIFLGEPGSLFVGFILGVLAIIAGGKLATALLVMAVPVLDLARVIYTRLKHKQPLFKGDREHLHYRLLDIGWSQRQVVFLYYLIALLFGLTTLFLQSKFKLLILVVLVVAMLVTSIWLNQKRASSA